MFPYHEAVIAVERSVRPGRERCAAETGGRSRKRGKAEAEIGIRRAVGATRADILVHFLAEAVILTGAGGMIGLLGGVATVFLFSELTGWPMAISFWGMLLPLQLALIVGIFFGLYPAKQAADVDPMVALRRK